MNEIYDIIVIGAGPGGYHSAIRAAQYGAEVAIVEKDKLGGTCLNWGCIPTKALYASAKLIESIEEKADNLGIKVGNISLEFGQAVDRKNKVVEELVQGINGLLKIWKIAIYQGFGSLNGGDSVSGYEIMIKKADSITFIKGKRIIIATGSQPAMIPAFNIDHERILTSDDILSPNFKTIPKSLLVIGGGVIGCEFSNIFKRFGSKITILEYLPTILATEEPLVVKELKSKFEKLGIEIYENQNVLNVENTGSGVKAMTCSATVPRDQIESAEKSYYEAELCLVSIGRAKLSTKIGLEKFGIEVERGAIKVDPETLETNTKGIYAIGDVIPGIMLAHVASYEGDVAIANALSSLGGFDIHPRKADYSIVPATIFTSPEIGSVGMRRKSISDRGIEIFMGRFTYSALGKAKCMGEEEGFIMILSDKKTDKIIGASCIGAEAPELIAEITLAMQNGLTTHQVAETIHSHPTISEMVLECAEDVHGMAIHKKGRKR
jgi:dihydrolipoamide dehydrogenase